MKSEYVFYGVYDKDEDSIIMSFYVPLLDIQEGKSVVQCISKLSRIGSSFRIEYTEDSDFIVFEKYSDLNCTSSSYVRSYHINFSDVLYGNSDFYNRSRIYVIEELPGVLKERGLDDEKLYTKISVFNKTTSNQTVDYVSVDHLIFKEIKYLKKNFTPTYYNFLCNDTLSISTYTPSHEGEDSLTMYTIRDLSKTSTLFYSLQTDTFSDIDCVDITEIQKMESDSVKASNYFLINQFRKDTCQNPQYGQVAISNGKCFPTNDYFYKVFTSELLHQENLEYEVLTSGKTSVKQYFGGKRKTKSLGGKDEYYMLLEVYPNYSCEDVPVFGKVFTPDCVKVSLFSNTYSVDKSGKESKFKYDQNSVIGVPLSSSMDCSGNHDEIMGMVNKKIEKAIVDDEVDILVSLSYCYNDKDMFFTADPQKSTTSLRFHSCSGYIPQFHLYPDSDICIPFETHPLQHNGTLCMDDTNYYNLSVVFVCVPSYCDGVLYSKTDACGRHGKCVAFNTCQCDNFWKVDEHDKCKELNIGTPGLITIILLSLFVCCVIILVVSCLFIILCISFLPERLSQGFGVSPIWYFAFKGVTYGTTEHRDFMIVSYRNHVLEFLNLEEFSYEENRLHRKRNYFHQKNKDRKITDMVEIVKGKPGSPFLGKGSFGSVYKGRRKKKRSKMRRNRKMCDIVEERIEITDPADEASLLLSNRMSVNDRSSGNNIKEKEEDEGEIEEEEGENEPTYETYSIKIYSNTEQRVGRQDKKRAERDFLQIHFHPNLVTILTYREEEMVDVEVFEDGVWVAKRVASPVFLYEFQDTTLEEFINKKVSEGEHLYVSEIAWILHSLLNGVCHLDGERIVHADLHPGNVFINEGTGMILIGDFGQCLDLHSNNRHSFRNKIRWYLVSAKDLEKYKAVERTIQSIYRSPGDVSGWSVGGWGLPPELETYETHPPSSYEKVMLNYQKCDVFAVGLIGVWLLNMKELKGEDHIKGHLERLKPKDVPKVEVKSKGERRVLQKIREIVMGMVEREFQKRPHVEDAVVRMDESLEYFKKKRKK